MKLQVFALDYDGTIASDGVLDPEVRGAIEQAHSQGIMVVLVTGCKPVRNASSVCQWFSPHSRSDIHGLST